LRGKKILLLGFDEPHNFQASNILEIKMLNQKFPKIMVISCLLMALAACQSNGQIHQGYNKFTKSNICELEKMTVKTQEGVNMIFTFSKQPNGDVKATVKSTGSSYGGFGFKHCIHMSKSNFVKLINSKSVRFEIEGYMSDRADITSIPSVRGQLSLDQIRALRNFNKNCS
jgi:hypothetical protein